MSMEAKIEDLESQIKVICVQVNKRIKEIGEVDIMTYRSDLVIKNLREKLCELYRQAVNSCNTYGDASKVCTVFREEPTCLTQLMLSEELACPVKKK